MATGEGSLGLIAQSVVRQGGGVLASIEQTVNLRITGRGSLSTITQAVQATGSGSIGSVAQVVRDSSQPYKFTGLINV